MFVGGRGTFYLWRVFHCGRGTFESLWVGGGGEGMTYLQGWKPQAGATYHTICVVAVLPPPPMAPGQRPL